MLEYYTTVLDTNVSIADTATIRLKFTPSAVDVGPIHDSGTSYLDLQPSGIDIKARHDAATIKLVFDLSASCEVMAPQVFVGYILGEARWSWTAVDRYMLEAMSRWTEQFTGEQVIRC